MGRFCVESVQVNGTVDDLYDFDYYLGPLSKLAATIQHGWNSGLSQGTNSGRIFWNTIYIDSKLDLRGPLGVGYQYCFQPYQ